MRELGKLMIQHVRNEFAMGKLSELMFQHVRTQFAMGKFRGAVLQRVRTMLPWRSWAEWCYSVEERRCLGKAGAERCYSV